MGARLRLEHGSVSGFGSCLRETSQLGCLTSGVSSKNFAVCSLSCKLFQLTLVERKKLIGLFARIPHFCELIFHNSKLPVINEQRRNPDDREPELQSSFGMELPCCY
jgi:hypothetical protein